MASLRRFLSSAWATQRVVTILVALNLLVASGWVVAKGWEWEQNRRMRAAQTRKALKISVAMGGFTSDQAQQIHDIGVEAVRSKTISDADLGVLLPMIADPIANESVPSPSDRKIRVLDVLRTATGVTSSQRRRIDEAVLRFLEREPNGKYEASAIIAATLLLKNGDPQIRSAVSRLAEGAQPARKRALLVVLSQNSSSARPSP